MRKVVREPDLRGPPSASHLGTPGAAEPFLGRPAAARPLGGGEGLFQAAGLFHGPFTPLLDHLIVPSIVGTLNLEWYPDGLLGFLPVGFFGTRVGLLFLMSNLL